MSTIENGKRIFSLLDVARSIQKTIADRYGSAVWIKAEMNKLNHYRQSGHCYPDLVEKNEGRVIAQVRAIIWNSDYLRINKKFLEVLNEPLKEGIKVLILAQVTFDPMYGLSLKILDIDPAFTLGDLEREKSETIQKLKDQGLFELNKSLALALLPQRIAVISVDSSKGYADFLQVIQTNAWGYKFFYQLFPAILQGEKAVETIIDQLKRIRKMKDRFDAVAIIRGGGGEVGLSCYNHFDLAKAVASFPLPVLTGIGHATNETVVEMVSHSNAITPTKLGEFLIQKFHNFSMPVLEAERKIVDRAKRMITEQNKMFASETRLFRSVLRNRLQQTRYELRDVSVTLSKEIKRGLILQGSTLLQLRQLLLTKWAVSLKNESVVIGNIEKNVGNMSPANVLKRGYSITLLNGRSVRDALAVKPDDKLVTHLHKGEITSTVNTKNNE